MLKGQFIGFILFRLLQKEISFVKIFFLMVLSSSENIEYFHIYVCFDVPYICLVSNDMFSSQNTPKMLFDLNKETIFLVALEKMHIIGRKLQMGSLVSETEIWYFRSNYSKSTLKKLYKGFAT